jgi:hypothetical protein
MDIITCEGACGFSYGVILNAGALLPFDMPPYASSSSSSSSGFSYGREPFDKACWTYPSRNDKLMST